MTLLATSLTATAQPRPNDDGTVTFNYKNDSAKKVMVDVQFAGRQEMTRGADGTWTATVGVKGDAHVLLFSRQMSLKCPANVFGNIPTDFIVRNQSATSIASFEMMPTSLPSRVIGTELILLLTMRSLIFSMLEFTSTQSAGLVMISLTKRFLT